VIRYRDEDVASRVSELTAGRGVDVAYDGVGASTFEASLASLAPFGLLASFGNASGPVPPVNLLSLRKKGVYLTRPSLGLHVAAPEDLRRGAHALFTALTDGTLEVLIGQRFRLEEARAAHESLETRLTVGSTLLLP
jgi:NADPH2:quinone reductase